MKFIFIAHPISGDVPGNLEQIRRISRDINLNEPNVVPLAPHYLDCHSLRDDVPKERKRGIKNGLAFLKSGIIDELRLYGDRISPGMVAEIELCESLGIDIVPMTVGTMNYKI